MSATNAPDERADAVEGIETGAVADVTPVRLDADALASTAPAYLRDLKAGLAEDGLLPAVVTVEARFDEDCRLAAQSVADEVRGYVRAAAFLGAARVELTVTAAADADAVETALRAVEERGRREGVAVEVSGALAD
jgi:hypothetical protein